jgi:AhpD family alkylhydroperoxidase
MPSDMLKHINMSIGAQDGVTQQEFSEAMLMSAITRHWSTVLNGSQIDKSDFRKEADQIMENIAKMMRESKGQMPTEENFLTSCSTPQEAYEDMEKTFGLVPKFFRYFPEEGIAGAWSEFKAVQLNPYTAIGSKHKELIGLSVAAQIPCDYCVYFHRSAAQLFGATDREIREAIGLSAVSRHWSTIFQGATADLAAFKSISDKMVSGARARAESHLHS